jgi:hypothetical protein
MFCVVVKAVHSGEWLPDIVASVRDERGIGSVDNDTEDDNLLLLPLLLVKLNLFDVLLLKLHA